MVEERNENLHDADGKNELPETQQLNNIPEIIPQKMMKIKMNRT